MLHSSKEKPQWDKPCKQLVPEEELNNIDSLYNCTLLLKRLLEELPLLQREQS